MIEFKVRKLQVNDLERGFLETLANLTEVSLTPETAKEISSKLDSNSFVFVAEDGNGMIVGTAMLIVTQRFIHHGGKVGYVEDVATRHGFERKGIGSALILAVTEEARKQGCYKAILDCGEHNVSFYEKQGFHRHEIEMRLSLV